MVPRFNILCRSLGYQPSTIEQQILRGYFTPRTVPTMRGKARVWAIRDIHALAVFEILFAAGMPAEEACQLSYLMPLGRRDHLLLLAWRPNRWSLGWTHEIVKSDGFEFGTWTASKKISSAVIIDLERTANEAAAAIEAASEIEMLPVVETHAPKSRKQTSAKRRPGPRS